LLRRQSLAGLERSLAEAAQLRPLIAVPAPQPATPTRVALIDRYRRLGALRMPTMSITRSDRGPKSDRHPSEWVIGFNRNR
jgi:hypothetical protein